MESRECVIEVFLDYGEAAMRFIGSILGVALLSSPALAFEGSDLEPHLKERLITILRQVERGCMQGDMNWLSSR
jgi:hypothetical protein